MSEFVTVGTTGDLPPGERLVAEANGVEIVVFNIDGVYYAVEDMCSHAAAYLSEGPLEQYAIECSKHRAKFDVRTGKVLCAPAFIPIKCYMVRVEGEAIQVGGRLYTAEIP
ncbi:MAG: non-heme iron oxygenase ferredoxin subunit [Chloroflexota bacterium]|nr:non-heme iron oxygenase ferredoxin subunit [Chloroflexota bacterium]